MLPPAGSIRKRHTQTDGDHRFLLSMSSQTVTEMRFYVVFHLPIQCCGKKLFPVFICVCFLMRSVFAYIGKRLQLTIY